MYSATSRHGNVTVTVTAYVHEPGSCRVSVIPVEPAKRPESKPFLYFQKNTCLSRNFFRRPGSPASHAG